EDRSHKPEQGNTMPSDSANMTAGSSPTFDLDDLRTHGRIAKFTDRALSNPYWLMGPLRRFFPITRIPHFNVVAVTRYDDVLEVLKRDDVFRVPFAQHVKDMNDGHNFLLGMAANKEHCRMQGSLMKVFRHEDIANIVTPKSAEFSEEVLARFKDGPFDAIEDLISYVPTRICETYFGVRVAGANPDQDRRDFAHWMIAMNTFTFGNPGNNPRFRAAA